MARCACGQGRILWDESANGPLSNDPDNPTQLGALLGGTNSILGATEYIPNGIYGDYFTFSVPTATEISKIWLSVDGAVAVWLGNPNFGTEYAHVTNPANGDVFPQWGLNSISTGVYGMYIANYDLSPGPSIANYRLDFFSQNIPEPGTPSLFFVGLGLIGFHCWRKL
jgi:hypothetical protein